MVKPALVLIAVLALVAGSTSQPQFHHFPPPPRAPHRRPPPGWRRPPPPSFHHFPPPPGGGGHRPPPPGQCYGNSCRAPGTTSFTLHFVVNHPTQVYVNGQLVASASGSPPVRTTAHYSGSCADMMVKMSNSDEDSPVAFAALIEHDGVTFGTRQVIKGFGDTDDETVFEKLIDPSLPILTPLYAVATNAPKPDFTTNAQFDFSSWSFSRIVDEVLDEPVIAFRKMEFDGALPQSWNDGPQETGDFGMRIFLPFCYPGKTPEGILYDFISS